MSKRMKNISRVIQSRDHAIHKLNREIFRLDQLGQNPEPIQRQKAKLVRRNFRDAQRAEARALQPEAALLPASAEPLW